MFGNSRDMGLEVCQREICVELGFSSFPVTRLSDLNELLRRNFVGLL
jgi:hypothetical protein